MSDSPLLTQIYAPLQRFRWMLILKAVARALVFSGVLLLAVAMMAALFPGQRIPRWHCWEAVFPTTIFLSTLGAGGVAVFMAWRRYGRISQVAEEAQNAFPEMGLRLSASLEVRTLDYCPISIRQALWMDTLRFFSLIPWQKWVCRLSTAIWTALALTVLAIQLILSLWAIEAERTARRLVPEAALSKKLEIKKKIPLPFKAILEITRPGEDQWATKIEAIPLTVQGKSPLGFQNLRLVASVNGGTPRDFPLDKATLSKAEDCPQIILDTIFLFT
ncbi:MAG: hypothetical protein PHV34_24840 [Verrucomicrobiae bacterium]|nr:hypothetical protein [Verrucomicrobiae bacterium]